jgi:HSP20 family protein
MSPFVALRREMDRLFDDVFRGFDGLPGFAGREFSWPSLEVSESDNEVTVTAELPGLEEKDVEVLLAEGMLTIRGEKKSETEDKERRFSERTYGRFERRVALPAEVDEDKVQASFRNGVLTVAMPKSAKAEAHVKRIPVNGGSGK